MSENEQKAGIKLLVCGKENCGKSYLTSQIDDAFVVSLDDKKYSFVVPHTNKTFEKLSDFIVDLGASIEGYYEKFGKMPRVIVFDTVTQMYSSLTRHSAKFKGYDVHNNINNETLNFNKFIEDDIIAKGIDVVVVAHTVFDADTRTYTIPATGQFKAAGSWLSIVDQALYLEKQDNLRIVHFDSPNTPSRSLLEDYKGKMDVNDFDINKFLDAMRNKNDDAQELEF